MNCLNNETQKKCAKSSFDFIDISFLSRPASDVWYTSMYNNTDNICSLNMLKSNYNIIAIENKYT